jgi:hypothetical protein
MARMVLIFSLLLLIGGCTGENFKQGLYDGLKVHNDLQSTPSERLGRPDPTYGQYQQMQK